VKGWRGNPGQPFFGEKMNYLVKVLIQIAGVALVQASPQLRKEICQFLNEQEAKAAQTANPWDDLIVKLGKAIMVCDGNNT
jgi:hypothetical protein